MALEIRPAWDRSETVMLKLCDHRRELVVSAGGERMQFVLREARLGRIHWVERAPGRRGARNVPVSVGDVVCHCLREWDAEQRVIELSLAAADRTASGTASIAVPASGRCGRTSAGRRTGGAPRRCARLHEPRATGRRSGARSRLLARAGGHAEEPVPCPGTGSFFVPETRQRARLEGPRTA
jgi:hypothetical protein